MRVSSHVSSWLHQSQAERQSSKGKSEPETTPHCVNKGHFWELDTCA